MKTITIHIFLLFANTLFSQKEIRGIIFDKTRGHELYASKVSIHFGETSKETKTDFDGAFTFQNIHSDTIRLSIREYGYDDYDTIIQLKKDITNLKIELISDSTSTISFSSYNKQKALEDIEKGTVKILLPGGIVGSAALSGDAAFEKKYGVKFYSQGCTRFPGDNEAEYNETVFKYLDHKFEKEWSEIIRKDAVGFKNRMK